jgi:hypothetical protein
LSPVATRQRIYRDFNDVRLCTELRNYMGLARRSLREGVEARASTQAQRAALNAALR